MTATEITSEQCERLARLYQLGSTGSEEGWEELYLEADTDGLAVTRDPLAAFDGRGWAERCEPLVVEGGMYYDRVQVAAGHERVSLVVIDCGDYRLAYQQ